MYPVGKAQKVVLDGLGLSASSFEEAEQIFEEIGIVVISVRQGRTSIPQINERHPHGYAEEGLFDTNYADRIREKLGQYCKPEFLATLTPSQPQNEEKEMTLKQALAQSQIEVAELYTDGKTIVVGYDYDENSYEISYKIGDMPPYARDHANTVEQAEQIIAHTALPYTLGSQDWEPREGE